MIGSDDDDGDHDDGDVDGYDDGDKSVQHGQS